MKTQNWFFITFWPMFDIERPFLAFFHCLKETHFAMAQHNWNMNYIYRGGCFTKNITKNIFNLCPGYAVHDQIIKIFALFQYRMPISVSSWYQTWVFKVTKSYSWGLLVPFWGLRFPRAKMRKAGSGAQGVTMPLFWGPFSSNTFLLFANQTHFSQNDQLCEAVASSV